MHVFTCSGSAVSILLSGGPLSGVVWGTKRGTKRGTKWTSHTYFFSYLQFVNKSAMLADKSYCLGLILGILLGQSPDLICDFILNLP